MPWHGPVEGGDQFPTLGHIAASWIESTLVITDGPKMGQPFRLYDEQYMHLLKRYRIHPDATEADGNDAIVHRGSMLVRGQKWGKDPLLAAVALFHAFGPCDYAGWDANGEPVGRPHPSPWVFVAALNDKQTDNTWLPLKAMVEQSDLVDLSGVEVNLDMIRLPCGNPIEPLTTTAYGRLGGRFTAGSLTENGLMTDTGGDQTGGSGKRSPLAFARTLIRSVSGMQGMWIGATNTWDPTEHSHAQRVYDAKPDTVYLDVKLSRKKVDFSDDEMLRDELLYLYGDSARERGGHVSVTSLMGDVRDASNGENEVRRFFLSEILAGEKAVVEPTVWTALESPKKKVKRGQSITLGFDGSRARDATALVGCRISDGKLFVIDMWKPRETGGKVPRAKVHAAVAAAFTAYDVHYLFGDPYLWQTELDEWEGKWPKKVVDFPTNQEQRMDRAIERFLTGISSAELCHDGDERLSAHLENAAIAKGKRKPARADADTGAPIEYYLKLAKKRDGLIDLAVAAVLAYEARGQAIEAGALSASKQEVWGFLE
jgi:hypothetical protein